jgi:hypothetical protein
MRVLLCDTNALDFMVFPTNTASASVSLETQDYSQGGSGSGFAAM